MDILLVVQILEKKFHFTITFPKNPDQNLDNANRPMAEAEISREDLIKYYS